MMKNFYLLVLIAYFASCSTINRAEKQVNSGNYDEAFDLLLKKYQKGVSDKKFAEYLPVFQEAYLKMVAHEEDKIERWKLENNPENYEKIYQTLVGLDNRQTKLKALLPIIVNGKEAHFPIKDYSQAIVNVRSDYVNHLYKEGKDLLATHNINDAREAFYNFEKVEKLSSNFSDISQLKDQAHFYGTNFVLISLRNQSNQMIPRNLERDLLQANTYNLDDFWNVFHEEAQKDVPYGYEVALDFEHIMVSPERQNVIIHNQEKQVKDGWEYLYQNGQQVVDSLGNPIKVDKYITVRSRVEEVILEKDAYVDGRIELIDLQSGKRIASDRLKSEFAFRERFAHFSGDRRAINDQLLALVNLRPVGFPSNEQMVYDCGTDIKNQMRRMLERTF